VVNKDVQNFEDILICFGATHERARHMNGHRVTAYTALMHTHRVVKSINTTMSSMPKCQALHMSCL